MSFAAAAGVAFEVRRGRQARHRREAECRGPPRCSTILASSALASALTKSSGQSIVSRAPRAFRSVAISLSRASLRPARTIRAPRVAQRRAVASAMADVAPGSQFAAEPAARQFPRMRRSYRHPSPEVGTHQRVPLQFLPARKRALEHVARNAAIFSRIERTPSLGDDGVEPRQQGERRRAAIGKISASVVPARGNDTTRRAEGRRRF